MQGELTQDCLLEENLLLRELTHRVNNEFASVIGFVSLISSRSKSHEVKSALAAVTDRLRRYAKAFHALNRPEQEILIDASSFLRQLCQSISRSKLEWQGIELVLVENPVEIDAERCWRLGMIVSELVENAARHAFVERKGKIYVELWLSGPCIICCVADNGKAAKEFRMGRGSQIVDKLAASLDGKLERRSGWLGSMTTLSFPRFPADTNKEQFEERGLATADLSQNIPPASVEAF
jgi:two-component sensor histidine kinase